MESNHASNGAPAAPSWTFLSNHSAVLLCILRVPGLRLKDVAKRVDITERAVQRIVADLEEAGYLTRKRSGRRNIYEVNLDIPLRHPVQAHRTVADLFAPILDVAALSGQGGEGSPESR
jgi:DNA-binding IclR family transcriptional regulator